MKRMVVDFLYYDQGCFIKAPAFRKGLYRLFETLTKRLN
jgi:hypothetical protein